MKFFVVYKPIKSQRYKRLWFSFRPEEQDTLSEALKTMKAFTNDANSSQKAILEEQLRNLRKQFNVVCNDMRNQQRLVEKMNSEIKRRKRQIGENQEQLKQLEDNKQLEDHKVLLLETRQKQKENQEVEEKWSTEMEVGARITEEKFELQKQITEKEADLKTLEAKNGQLDKSSEKAKAWSSVTRRILKTCYRETSEDATLEQIMSFLEHDAQTLSRNNETVALWGMRIQQHWKMGDWTLKMWGVTQREEDAWSKKMFCLFRGQLDRVEQAIWHMKYGANPTAEKCRGVRDTLYDPQFQEAQRSAEIDVVASVARRNRGMALPAKRKWN